VIRVYASPSATPDGATDDDPSPTLFVPDLVVVGAASRDVTAEDPRGWRLGGAVTYCSLTAARLGLRVGCVVGVDELASGAWELELLEAAGVAVRRVALESGPVFENVERDGHRRQRWMSRSQRVAEDALPPEWRYARGWLLVPVAGEVGEGWAGIPEASARVGVGWQGLLREFPPDGWVRRIDPGPSDLLSRAGLVCASADDLAPGAELERLRPMAPGAAIVLTAGAAGGLALREGSASRYSAIASEEVVDPTGAGDVFLAALMAVWLLAGELATPRALRFAAAAGSCAVEAAGLAGVPTAAMVAARLRPLR
jgi:sugar/nucleoside kinase (ribokinase family)